MIDKTTDLQRTVFITLAGETRQVVIKRITAEHCWHAEVAVVCKFRTGTKLHTRHQPQVFENSKQQGRYSGADDYFFGTEVIHNHHARVVAWADKRPGDSSWTANEVKP
jgi:hypothetical protein